MRLIFVRLNIRGMVMGRDGYLEHGGYEWYRGNAVEHERKPQGIGPLHLSTQTLRVSISLSNPTHPSPATPSPKTFIPYSVQTPDSHTLCLSIVRQRVERGRGGW